MRIGYSLRHIHDPVLSSLKMKGLRLIFFLFLHASRYPRPHICIRIAYVSVAVNVPAVTPRYHGTVQKISKVTWNKRRLRHIHVKKIYYFDSCWSVYFRVIPLKANKVNTSQCSLTQRSKTLSNTYFCTSSKNFNYIHNILLCFTS
jgi:hypothetical protein